jgi:hypothetical protein
MASRLRSSAQQPSTVPAGRTSPRRSQCCCASG